MFDFVEEVLSERFMRDKWQGYQVEFNDSMIHSLKDRISSRTDLSDDEVKFKISKGIDYIIKKDMKGFFKRKSMVAINFKKSNFKAMIMINPDDKYVRLSTILASDMNVKNAIRWDINESFDELFEFELNM